MNKIFSKKLLIIFSTLLAASYSIIWACGWSDWDEYGVSAFAPEAFVDNAYKPFFYSDMFYYEMGHDNNHVYRFNDEIVQEWKRYVGSSAGDSDLNYFLLKASSGLVDSVLTMPVKSLPATIAGMQLVKNKTDKKVAAFFKFLSFAKGNEAYASRSFNYWDYDEKEQVKTLDPMHVANRVEMEKQMRNAPDDFIGQRYFFQIVRAYFFAGDYNQCIAFYEKNSGNYPANILAARALSYVAGAYYKQKNYAKANYLYNKVYDAGDDFKTVAHYSFHPQDDTDWKQTLALCQNKQEQITLWHLLGIYFDEDRAIREIYALDPKSQKLELLLARLINLQEIKCNTESAEYGWGNYRPGKDSLDKNVLALVSNIADAQKTAKPYLWHISAAYLHFINQDFAKAKAYYTKAEKTIPKEELPQAQLRLFQLMNNVAATTKLDKKSEAFLLADLEWLQQISKQPIPSLRYDQAYEWIKMKMSNQYKKQKEIQRSELFVHTDSFYTDPAKVASLKAFLLNENVTPFEQYCKTIYPIPVEEISEFQYVNLTYQDKIDEALQLYAASGTKVTNGGELPGNPFNGNIQDCHDCDHAAQQKVKYTKLDLLKKMKEMKDNIAAGKDVYANALLLGNAHYNISHYGNARYFYEGAVIGTSHSAPDMLPSEFSAMLLQQGLAIKYYKRALAAASTDEQKAKLTYFLLKCERNERYNQLYKDPGFRSWNYAKMPGTNFGLLAPYKNTQYYKEVLAECGYFQSYLGLK